MALLRLNRVQSIKARLSIVFLFLFLLVVVLGLESLRSLRSVNGAAAEIRLRWLPGTRALGDLNNYTTDYPAAEADLRRAAAPAERAAIARQIGALDRGIAAALQAFDEIPRNTAEDALFRRFRSEWAEYREIVARSEAAASADAKLGARGPHEAELKAHYMSASAALGSLTSYNSSSAREASDESDLTYASATRRIVVTILAIGLLVAGAMLHVTRSISAPLVDLAARMHALAASETLTEVRGLERPDEIGEMARAVVVFRNNAVDLARNRQALAQQAAVLREKLAEEQRVTLLQRNFVAMASHEFRTPLAIIDGHAQRLISMRDRLTAAELVERARKVRNVVHRITQLIDNLLGSSRLIDGPKDLNYHPVSVDLRGMLGDVCNLQRELTPEAAIDEDLGPEPLVVFGDSSLLSQVFGNLLSNAVKYSPGGGCVRVSARRDEDLIAVAIEDQGIGIPEDDRPHVFERYYRGSNTSGIVGSGVGLYLVKTIVDLHRGSIELESIEGQGCRFSLKLPHPAAPYGGDVEPEIPRAHFRGQRQLDFVDKA